MLAPSDIPWPNEKSKLLDLINTRVQAAKTGNPLLEQFAHVNLEDAVRTLPDNWSIQPTESHDNLDLNSRGEDHRAASDIPSGGG